MRHLLVLAACLVLAPFLAAQPAELVIDVDDSRPLAEIAGKLQKRYPIAVSYEEGPWEYPFDLEELTHPVPTLFPRRAAMTFRHPVNGDAPNYRAVVTALLEQYEAADGRIRFRLEEPCDGSFDLIASQMMDRTGRWVNVAPLLSTKVSLSEHERTINDLMDEIVTQLNDSSPIPVQYGFFPLNLFRQNSVRLGAKDQPAREVMRQAFQGLLYRVSWRVEYNLSCRCYVLGFLLGRGPEYETFPGNQLLPDPH